MALAAPAMIGGDEEGVADAVGQAGRGGGAGGAGGDGGEDRDAERAADLVAGGVQARTASRSRGRRRR